MIENLSSWAEQIIVAVIIATLIEMILPNGNNKKYIKAVIGVYILFTIISPIFSDKVNLNFDQFDYDQYFKNTQSYQTMSDSLISYNDQSTEEIYQINLEQDMKQKLKQKGYLTQKITINIELKQGKNYGQIKQIDLRLSKIEEDDDEKNDEISNININTIEKVNIGNYVTNTTSDDSNENKTSEKLSSKEEKQIKEYLSEVYDVKTKNIRINENT